MTYITADGFAKGLQGAEALANGFNRANEWEHRMMQKARELTGDQNPMFNMAPTLELVKLADSMGYDVVRR